MGVGVRIDTTQAQEELRRMLENASNPRPLLSRIGEYGVSTTKARFARGKTLWPAKHPYFAELERRTQGSGDVPLTFRGHLMQSITKDVRPPDSVRVGSPLKYARTQQFGSGGPRPFYLSIIPDTEPGARGTKYQRDAYGRLLGRITLRQDAAAKRQLVTIDVRPRAFLVPPTDAEWEEIGELIGEFLFGRAA